MKKQLVFLANSILLLSSTHTSHALQSPQPTPGKVTVINTTRDDIEVYFYATDANKIGETPCQTYIKAVPPRNSASVEPQGCVINLFEVRHTPEEDFEHSTKEYLSNDDQQTETFWEYRGPNIIVQKKYKS